MQLSKFADYALRVLMHLGRSDDSLLTIRDVAAAQAVSENHLFKVVQQLARSGYIHTSRGRGGGIRLARPARHISIGQVLRDVEAQTPVECFAPDYAGACRLFPRCALRGALARANDAFLKTLDTITLRDLLPAPSQARVTGISISPGGDSVKIRRQP